MPRFWALLRKMHAQEVADWTVSALQLPPRRVTELALPAKDTLRPGPQRARGEGRIGVRWRDGRVRVERLYQDGCAKLRAPRDRDIGGVEAVLINTAGGLTGGDRLDWSAAVGEDSQLTLTSQACERIYRSAGGPAEVNVRLRGEDRLNSPLASPGDHSLRRRRARPPL